MSEELKERLKYLAWPGAWATACLISVVACTWSALGGFFALMLGIVVWIEAFRTSLIGKQLRELNDLLLFHRVSVTAQLLARDSAALMAHVQALQAQAEEGEVIEALEDAPTEEIPQIG